MAAAEKGPIGESMMIRTQLFTYLRSAFGPLEQEDDDDNGPGMRTHHPESSSLPNMPSSSSISPASLAIGTSDYEGTTVPYGPPSQESRVTVEPLNYSTTTTPEADSHLLAAGPHQREERKKGWRGFLGDVFILRRRAGNAR